MGARLCLENCTIFLSLIQFYKLRNIFEDPLVNYLHSSMIAVPYTRKMAARF